MTRAQTPIGGGADPALAAPEPFPQMPGGMAPPQQGPTEVPPLPGAPLPTPPEDEQGEELSPEEQVMFSSLLTCGRRTKTLTVFEHTVVVQTLCCDDDLRIGMRVKDYQGTSGEQRAYQVAVVAAGLRTIDNQPLVAPTLFENADPEALYEEKFKKVSKMYPTVVSQIYRAIMDAEVEFVKLATRLGKLDG